MLSIIRHSLVATSLILPTVFSQAQNCGADVSVYVNASAAVTAYQPFHLPFGPGEEDSETWTWTLQTVSYDLNGPNGTAEDRLWLSTQAQLNLTDPNWGFLGCGMIMHGLRHGTIVNGQEDPGNCSSIFNSACFRALDNSTNLTSQSLSPLVGRGNAQDICSRFAYLGTDGTYGLPDECSGAFDPDAWIQTFGKGDIFVPKTHMLMLTAVFSSPQTEYICSSDPGAGSQFDPMATWGAAPYDTGDMTAYDNLTTSVTPVMITLFTNRTVNDTRSSQDFTAQELICLRPSIVEAGSVQPTIIPNTASSSGYSSFLVWTMLSISLLAVLTDVSL